MRIPFEKRGRFNTLTDLKNLVEKFDGVGNDEILRRLLSWDSLLKEVFLKHGVGYATIFESSDKWDVALHDFKSEILFAINEELNSLDPGFQHNILSKKISEMTGYEYKRFLKILSEQHD